MAREARLGKPRAPIQLTQGEDGVRIDIPVRRTKLTWAVGVPQLVMAVLFSVVYAAIAIYIVVILVSGGAIAALSGRIASLAVPFIIIVMLLLLVVTYGVYPLIAVTSAYALFGTTVVTVEAGKFSLRRRVGRISVPLARLGAIQFDPDSPIVVEVRQDRRCRSYVNLRQGSGRTGHEVGFGLKDLSQPQAEQIAAVLGEALSGRVEPALPADGVM